MKYAIIEDVIARFLYPILPTVQGEQDYHTVHATSKLQQASAREIDTFLGGRDFGHLVLIVSDASYAMVALAT
jgi:phage gp36-like protein